jgi:GxxExxY protein
MRDIEDVAREIVDSAFKVHKTLGPGLLESVYELALYYELTKRGLRVERQVPVNVEYEGVSLGTGFRIDLLVDDRIIVELKSVDKMNPVFRFQTLTHLRLAQKSIGFLINFNVPLIKDGIQRFML